MGNNIQQSLDWSSVEIGKHSYATSSIVRAFAERGTSRFTAKLEFDDQGTVTLLSDIQ